MQTQTQKIKKLGKVVTGKTPPTTKTEYFGGDYPFITPSDIADYKVRHISSVDRTVTEEWKKKAIKYLLPQNTVCYVCIGSTVGKMCMVDRDSFSNQQINSIICNQSVADPDYIFYLLRTKLPWLKMIADASGAGKGIINKTTFENLELKVPNLPIQQEISGALKTYDDLIENNERRIKILEEVAQKLYTEWFVKFKFPGHEKTKFVDSGTKFGKIPEGWEVKKLGKVIDPQYGYTATAQDEPSFPKYLRGTDINKESFIQWSNVPNCSIDQKLYKKYKVQKYDVFIIRMADPGKIGICEREVDAVFASYLIRLEIKNDITPYYLFLTLTSEYFQGLITGSSSGTTRKSINAEYIKTINFILPPKELLTIFESKTQTFRENLTKLLEVNESLQEMRDLLIPQLATGKRELK